MALVLACISSITVLLIFILTILHIFYWRDMFPNDVAIAITNERRQKKWSEFDPELNTTSEVSLEEAWAQITKSTKDQAPGIYT